MFKACLIAVPAAVLAILVAPGPAHAQQCTTNADCPAGLACQAAPEEICTAPACVAGSECPPATCTTRAVSACLPIPCGADSDCPTGMICYQDTIEECSGGGVACAPADPAMDAAVPYCPPPPPPECTTTTISACVPAWVLPCQTAADCGAGFTCDPEEDCGCSAGGSPGFAPAIDGGTVPPPPPPECTCTPTGQNRCNPVPTTCTADSDCLPGWSCLPDPNQADVACPAPDPAMDAAVPYCPPPAPPVLRCAPPFTEAMRSGFGSSDGSGSLEVGGATNPPPATDPGATSPQSSESEGGCQVAPGSAAPSAALLLGLFALLGLRRRR